MNKAFDIRKISDVEELSIFLPNIDGYEYTISKELFIESLLNLSNFLKKPDWMVYQYGCFKPFGKPNLIFSLKQAVTLGIQLGSLSRFINFQTLVKGFLNPTQFTDSCLEAKTAYWFLNKNGFESMIFSPEYKLGNKIKRPEFDVLFSFGKITVECKRPHIFVQTAFNKHNRLVKEFESEMKKVNWPKDLRLEIEVISPIRGSILKLVKNAIESSLRYKTELKKSINILEMINIHIVKKNKPFKLTNFKFGTDILSITNKPTGLLNPEFTSLRVTNKQIESQITRSIGKRISKALKQLPDENGNFIFLEGAPLSILEEACKRRISDSAYAKIAAFGLWDDNTLRFIYKKQNRHILNNLGLKC